MTSDAKKKGQRKKFSSSLPPTIPRKRTDSPRHHPFRRDLDVVWLRPALRQLLDVAKHDRGEPHVVAARGARRAHVLPGAEAFAVAVGVGAVGGGGGVRDGSGGPVVFFFLSSAFSG